MTSLEAPNSQTIKESAMYSPRTGQWLSEDPIEFEALDENLKRYVHNSPTMLTDPTGLFDNTFAIILANYGPFGPVAPRAPITARPPTASRRPTRRPTPGIETELATPEDVRDRLFPAPRMFGE